MPLAGPAVPLPALAPDSVELSAAGWSLVLPNREARLAGTPPAEAVSGRGG